MCVSTKVYMCTVIRDGQGQSTNPWGSPSFFSDIMSASHLDSPLICLVDDTGRELRGVLFVGPLIMRAPLVMKETHVLLPFPCGFA